jgi:hypothetical protein
LKTIQKRNRKGNRNSRKIEKAILAQAGPLSPARARARAPPLPDRRVPHVGANPIAPLSLSLSVAWARPVGAVSLTRARSLSLCPAVPTCQLVLNLPPMISPPWMRPCPRVLRPRPSPAPWPPTSPLPFAPFAQLPRPLSLCPCEPRALPPPADIHNLFRGRCCVRAPSSATVSFALPSATRYTLRCALSLPVAPVHAHRRSSCAVGAPLSSTRGFTAPPPFSKRPGVRT